MAGRGGFVGEGEADVFFIGVGCCAVEVGVVVGEGGEDGVGCIFVFAVPEA